MRFNILRSLRDFLLSFCSCVTGTWKGWGKNLWFFYCISDHTVRLEPTLFFDDWPVFLSSMLTGNIIQYIISKHPQQAHPDAMRIFKFLFKSEFQCFMHKFPSWYSDLVKWTSKYSTIPLGIGSNHPWMCPNYLC